MGEHLSWSMNQERESAIVFNLKAIKIAGPVLCGKAILHEDVQCTRIPGMRCHSYSATNWAVSERIVRDSAVSRICGAW